MPEELVIKHASRPRLLAANKYDIMYQDIITETPHAVPEPTLYQDPQLVDLVESPTMVFHNSGASRPDTDDFYTEWTISGVELIYDPAHPRSTWALRGGDGRYCMSAIYGLLPSTYGSGYTITNINHLYVGGNWKGQLLYNMENGVYVAAGAMFALSIGGNAASIYYDVDLVRNSTGEDVHVTGSSSEYSVPNGPYSTQMALYVPMSSFSGRGNVTCEVTMTETPAN